MEELVSFDVLPEDCVSAICSLTSPQDACRISLVSSSFRSAADSDMAWDRFLPFDWEDIMKRAVIPLKFSSKKEMFLQLCHPILLDGGKQIIALEKSTGLKSYTLSARELTILHSNESNNWCWKPKPESRFAEVAELKTSNRIEIEAKIKSQMLSPNTKYGAYLIIQTSENSFGLDSIPSEVTIVIADNVIENTAYLSPKCETKQQIESLFYANRARMMKMRVENGGDDRFPMARSDGWAEIEIGEFFNGNEIDQDIRMSLRETKGHQLKGGLTVEGIEIRPKN
ncbi:OLC1v1001948C1 [Oldenlandia corymbosa var. corymbosa]|uniref:OLC1v1001948C1 n=1 Tax=Oldenlandia corymbosa var. corymbosa TaxID=529605 RepID=A0AAV1D6H7_OLDCO|nr:OLC1v1001948C1 [Oldenlandia corymbosa var. corymbosa]